MDKATELSIFRSAVRTALWVALVIFGGAICSRAASRTAATSGARSPATPAPAVAPFWAIRSRLTFGLQVGYGLENNIPHNVSHINMIIAQPQVGFIVWDSPNSRLPVDRFELIGEGILGSAFHPGGHLLGGTLFMRFDFKPVGRVVPFFDAGSGPLNTSLYQNAEELSGPTQFLSEGGAGLQYFFKPQRAIVFEYRYFHMSNAGLQEPNHGFNGSMLTIGFRWLHRPRPAAATASTGGPFHIFHFW